jgi:O-antigen/teichoic acid export membrane protein
MRLRTAFSWALAGNVGYAGLQWLTLVAIARLGTPAMVGQFALALAVTAPVFLLTNLALRNVQASDGASRFGFEVYLGLRLWSLPVALTLIAVIAWTTQVGYSTRAIILLVGLAKAAESLSDLVYGGLQQRERMDHVGRSLLVRGTTSVAAVAAVLAVWGRLDYAVTAMVVAWIVVLLALDLRIAGRVRLLPTQRRMRLVRSGTLNWQHLHDLLRTAAPLGAVASLTSLAAVFPKYVLRAIHGDHALGLYAGLAYLIYGGTTAMAALGQAVLPRMAKYIADGEADAYALLMRQVLLFSAGCALLAVVIVAGTGHMLLTVTYGREYAEQAPLLYILSIGGAIGFVGTILMIGAIARRQFADMARAWLVIVVVTGLVSIVFIQQWGIVGAALVTVITAVAQVSGGWWLMIRASRSTAAIAVSMRDGGFKGAL